MAMVLDGTGGITTNSGTLLSTSDATINGLTVGKGGGNQTYATAVGVGALGSNTTGYGTAIGHNAGNANLTGVSFVAVGAFAGQSATAGYFTAVGHGSLSSNTTGTYNTAVGTQDGSGYGAMRFNTTGSYNVAVGTGALAQNTTASNNTAVGYQAMYSNTTGQSGTGLSTAVGSQALYSATGSRYDVAIGSQALYTFGGGFSQIAIGYQAMYSTTNASNCHGNVGIGSYCSYTGILAALYSNTTGSQNVAVGHGSLASNTTAYNNTALGYQSGYSITTGDNNVCIGYQAGFSQQSITTGAQNTIIGANAGLNTSSGTYQVVIGYNCQSAGNAGYVTIGHNTGADRIYAQYTSSATWTRVSDSRIKKDIQDNNLGLEFINKLRTVTYKKRAPSEMAPDFVFYDEKETDVLYKKKMHGFIAQEVKQALDEVGETDFNGWHEMDNGVQGVSYEMFVMPLVKAVQELKALVDAQAAEIAELKAKVM